EISMEIQAALGSEIVMAFDECPPGDAGFERTRESLNLTIRWAERSKRRFEQLQASGADTGHIADNSSGLSGNQALFGIIQGAG
ncbi:tRNA-guanine transglycosylase, partial [Escherichia coli]|nr:tRNA-guanine transglycosylase [Escherichia coli]